MIFKYGPFAFADGEARPTSFRMEGKRGNRLVLESVTRSLDIEFEIIRDGQQLLTNRFNQIAAAIQVDGRDAGFFHSTGGRSAVYLDSAISSSGVYITTYPSLNEMGEADYANSLKGRCGFAAVYEPGIIGGGGGGGGEQLTDYSESLSFNGTGGPRIVWVENDRSAPEKYVLTNHTICTCEQRGSLSSLSPSVQPNPPMFPDLEIVESRNISPVVGSRSDGETTYGISWSYLFQSSGPFSGQPKVR